MPLARGNAIRRRQALGLREQLVRRPPPRERARRRRGPSAPGRRRGLSSSSRIHCAAVRQPDEGGQPRGGRRPALAWAPIGVWQVASRASTTARSAVRHAERVAVGHRPQRARPRRASSAARLEREAALAGRGHERVGSSGVPSPPRPSRSSPAAASTMASKSPSASRRRRVSTLPRRSRTSRSGPQRPAAARGGAGSPCRPRRPRASSSSDAGAAERVARVGALGHADDRQAVGQLGRHVLGRVHGQVDSRRRAAPPRSPSRSATCRGRPLESRRWGLTPESPEVVIGTISTSSGSRSATSRAWASASALPRVPSRITGAAPAAGVEPRDLGGLRPRAALSAASSPNSSRSACT